MDIEQGLNYRNAEWSLTENRKGWPLDRADRKIGRQSVHWAVVDRGRRAEWTMDSSLQKSGRAE